MTAKSKKNSAEEPVTEAVSLIHLVFQEADIETLKKAMEADESLQGDVEIIRDDYAVGPIQNIQEPEGYQQRKAWWKELVDFSPYNSDQLMNLVDDRLAVHQLKRRLTENEKDVVWIWIGQNQHDVCGYFWIISQLKEFQGRIFVLFLNNLPFINEKGSIFYPSAIHEIMPSEFRKAKKLARAVTLSEFEVDPDEWNRLMQENGGVRILEGGKKIISKEAGYFDQDILNNLTSEPQKGNRAMQNILGKMKIKTGDVFLLWRMQELAKEQKLELTGDPSKGWKEFEVRLKKAAATEAPIEPTTPL